MRENSLTSIPESQNAAAAAKREEEAAAKREEEAAEAKRVAEEAAEAKRVAEELPEDFSRLETETDLLRSLADSSLRDDLRIPELTGVNVGRRLGNGFTNFKIIFTSPENAKNILSKLKRIFPDEKKLKMGHFFLEWKIQFCQSLIREKVKTK